MYFIKYSPLKEKLRNRELSEREALPYLIVFMALSMAVTSFPLYDGFNIWDAISGILSVVIAVWGVVYSYKCNQGADGYDLIQKYFVLGWVVAIRCLLGFIPAAIVCYVGAELLGLVSDESNWVDVTITSVFLIVLYFKTGRHIKDTTREQDSAHQSTTRSEPKSE